MPDGATRVPPDARDRGRSRRSREVQPDEVQAGLADHDAAIVVQLLLVAEDGKVDP